MNFVICMIKNVWVNCLYVNWIAFALFVCNKCIVGLVLIIISVFQNLDTQRTWMAWEMLTGTIFFW